MDPFQNWKGWQKNLDSFFGKEFFNGFDSLLQPNHNSFPLINIYQTENELILLASIPGLDDVNSVDVFIDYQTIELKGDVQLRYKGFHITQEEIFRGRFEKKISLPFPVKEDKVEANYQNGLLIIHLHRLIPDSRTRQRISVKKIDD